MMRRWRTLLRVVGMMLSITDALLYYEIFRRLTRRYKRQRNVRDFNDSRRAHFFDLAWWSDEGTKKLKRLRRFGFKGVPENRNERG
jgi:hypothetical protein